MDIDESDLGSYVEKAKKIVSKELKVPTGYSLIWSGQYESLERVKENLSYIVPLTLALIFLLIYLNTGGVTKTFTSYC